MAKPRVFISSTFYDLKQIRADLDNFIRSLGYDVVRNEEGAIPYEKDFRLEEYCYKEINSIDILVAIIGGRFGSVSAADERYSISNTEIKTAIEHNKQVYIFIDKEVDSEYYTYLGNKDSDFSKNIKYAHVDNIKIYQFIEEIRSLKRNNVIHAFSSSSDIINFLKEQWAGLFQRFLQNKTNEAEFDALKQLHTSLNTLKELTDYLVSVNANNSNTINDILINNHPVFKALRKEMNWKFPIIFSSLEELRLLMAPWGFAMPPNSDKPGYFEFKNDKGRVNIYIANSIFDKLNDNKLLPTTNLSSNELVIKVIVSVNNGADDLPF